MSEKITVRDFDPLKDMIQCLEIYNYYVKETIYTFDLEPVSASHFNSKLSSNHPFLVIDINDKVCGYAYATSFRAKPAYQSTVEVSIYLDKSCQQKGYGSELMRTLLKRLENQYHVVVGGAVASNESSIRLLEKFGFEKVAHYKQVGFKFGEFIDVVAFQKFLSQ